MGRLDKWEFGDLSPTLHDVPCKLGNSSIETGIVRPKTAKWWDLRQSFPVKHPNNPTLPKFPNLGAKPWTFLPHSFRLPRCGAEVSVGRHGEQRHSSVERLDLLAWQGENRGWQMMRLARIIGENGEIKRKLPLSRGVQKRVNVQVAMCQIGIRSPSGFPFGFLQNGYP